MPPYTHHTALFDEAAHAQMQCIIPLVVLFFNPWSHAVHLRLFLSEYRKTGVEGNEEAEHIPFYLRKQSPHHGAVAAQFCDSG